MLCNNYQDKYPKSPHPKKKRKKKKRNKEEEDEKLAQNITAWAISCTSRDALPSLSTLIGPS